MSQKKKHGESDSEISTPLFLLRCLQIGIPMSELEYVTIGMVVDMYIEMQNERTEETEETEATQADFDSF